jgi:hypothetical protein
MPTTLAQDYQHGETEKQGPGIHEDAEPDRNPLSRAVTTDSVLPPPPDGGLHAWLKVFGGFFIYVNIWSISPILSVYHYTNVSVGASPYPMVPSKPTTARTSFATKHPPPYPGSAPYKPGYSSLSASCPVPCSIWATSAPCSSLAISSSSLVS